MYLLSSSNVEGGAVIVTRWYPFFSSVLRVPRFLHTLLHFLFSASSYHRLPVFHFLFSFIHLRDKLATKKKLLTLPGTNICICFNLDVSTPHLFV